MTGHYYCYIDDSIFVLVIKWKLICQAATRTVPGCVMGVEVSTRPKHHHSDGISVHGVRETSQC